MNGFMLSTLCIYLTDKGFDSLPHSHGESEAWNLIKSKLLPSEVPAQRCFKI